jgi:dUTP pyrophosphatase
MLLYYCKKNKTMEVQINIRNTSLNDMPHYATEGAAGMDIRANIEDKITLKSLERILVPTGIFMEIPEGFEVQVRPRSGLALKNGITCLNTPGTIDSDYRGEIKVLLINLSNEDQYIVHSDRIAQLIVAKVEKAKLIQVEVLNDTVRAAGGFGHTGV